MNRKMLVTAILLTCGSLLMGQDIVKKIFYKSEYGGKTTSEEKAKIVELTIQEGEGIVRYEARELKPDKLLQLRRYKDGHPFGKWLYIAANGKDYYELNYIDAPDELLQYDLVKKTLLVETDGVFEAPVFPQNGNDFFQFVAMHLSYPIKAAMQGIQGEVISRFTIDESGKIQDFTILESAHLLLDQEVARIVSLSPDWIPAKLNGKPVKVNVVMPTTFILSGF